MANKFFKTPKTRAWFITTVSIATLVVVLDCVAFTALSNLLDTISPAKPITEGNGSYYEKTTESKQAARENSNEVNKKVADEGFVLLKNQNNSLPLKAGAKISVFGKNSAKLVYGTSGSGASSNDNAITMHDTLTSAGFEVNPTLEEFYESDASGAGRPANPKIENGGNVNLYSGETPIDSYTSEVTNSYSEYKDAAVIVFARVSGEGFDLPMQLSSDSSKHYLELDDDEKALIDHVTAQGFGKVIVYINSNNQIEAGDLLDNDKIDAILWSGGLGDTGANAFGRILAGTVNPSGHLADTWVRDFTADPVWQNFGDNRVTDGDAYTEDGTVTSHTFVDYEEGIYVGYRYWETRGETDGETWYDQNVVFPFGYGLSYTTFDWEVTNKDDIASQALTADGTYEVKVKVTNTGEVAGKDVVELYTKLPYTSGGIEKPSKVLSAFAKTQLLEPNESEELTLEVNPYYFASYDYNDKDGDGFIGYELEQGDYTFTISSDVHTDKETIALPKLDTTIHIENDPVTGTKVENLFADADDHLQTVLSRSDWEGTFPASPTDDERNVYWILDNMDDDNGEDLDIEALDDDTTTTNPFTTDTMPTQGQVTKTVDDEDEEGNPIQRGLLLKDLINADYDDPDWEDLLNEISIDEMKNMYSYAAFWTQGIDSIGKSMSYQSDGPAGFTNFMVPDIFEGCASVCNETVTSATWNVELVEELGVAIGEEGLQGYNGVPYSGWYAPGMNIHRGQFGGRIGEYYSEDPLLTGKLAAATIRGCKQKGVQCYMKHFAVNEQETDRAGIDTWVTEQALREVYLKPFEIAVKEGQGNAVMSSFNRIGTTWTGGDYRLLTQVLREEWGFVGAVICDFNTNPHMDTRQMAYAGGDLNLATTPKPWVDSSNATDVTILRQCTKNTLYLLAHSNFLNAEIIGYTMPLWRLLVAIIEPVIFVGLGVWGAIVIVQTYRKPKAVQKPEEKTQGN